MQTVADLVADAREREGVLFSAADASADHGYRAACTTAWKAGNVLRHYGVRTGDRVAVVVGPKDPEDSDEPGHVGGSPDPLLAMLGAMTNGALVDPDPPGVVDATVLVTPDPWLDRFERGVGTTAMAYGGPPEDPAVAHFEREAWSENAVAPPADVGPGDPALAGAEVYAHGDLLAASRRVVADAGLDETDDVAIRAPVTNAGTLVAGLLAPMRVGATVLLGADATGTIAVATGEAPEARVVEPHAVLS